MPKASTKTTTTTNSNGTTGLLLSLPRSDLGGQNSHKSNKLSTSLNTTSKKADLVLFQLPKNKEFQSDFYAGKCQLLANGHSASLVSPTTSFRLVAVGTSNTLVVWKDNKNDGDGKSTSTSDEEPPTKRLKNNDKVAACRLIQPGGSGASFLVTQSHTIEPRDLLQWFVERQKSGGESATSTTTNKAGVPTSLLSNLFQASTVEIRAALSQIPNVAAFESSGGESNDSNDTTTSAQEDYWQLIRDEEVLCGQRALTEFAIDLDGNVFENDGVAVMEDVASGVSKRLVPLLMEYDITNAHGDATLSSNSTAEERSLAIAKTTVFLAQKEPAKKKMDSRTVRLDPNIIAFYVLRDLFMEYPNYAMSDLLQKWVGRLPMGDVFERCASLEWLQEQGFVPQQLVTEDVDDNTANAGATNSATGKVIRLAAPSTVLAWKKSTGASS